MKIIINNDEKLVNEIKLKLKENNGFCPCQLVKNDDTKCICKEFRQTNTLGLCHCGLYEKIED